MIPGLLAAALTCAALALVLAHEPLHRAGLALSVCLLAAPIGAQLHRGAPPGSPIAIAGWIVLAIVAVVAVVRPRRLWPWSLPLALAAGASADLAVGPTLPLGGALLPLLLIAPARWLARPGQGIALRVAASWLVTVAALNVALPLTTPTPGYARDHME